MKLRQHSIGREAGTAFALLALYVLTLLLPLHQVAGMQRELSALGYETVGKWSVCLDAGVGDEDEPERATALKCSASGVAKHQFTAPPPGAAEPMRVEAAVAVRHGLPAWLPTQRIAAHFGQSRAPPVGA